jgi:hypothetical protein
VPPFLTTAHARVKKATIDKPLFKPITNTENMKALLLPKKIILVALFLFTGLLAIQAQTATAPSSGDGSAGNPYQIASLENLYWIAANSTRWAYHYIQTADIDATETSTWDTNQGFTPIGNGSTAFTGLYDGQNYSINSMAIDRPSINNVGLFGYVSAGTLTNVLMDDCSIEGVNTVGGLAGKIAGNSSVSGCTISGSVTGTSKIGGLIGENENTSVRITDCHTTGTVVGSTYVGGLVGSNYFGISNCSSTAWVRSSGDYIGGLVGVHQGDAIRNCYATGAVEASTYGGGLVGSNAYQIINCYATGNVSGTSRLGGLVGNTGGSSSITDSYSAGTISGSTLRGGLVGNTRALVTLQPVITTTPSLEILTTHGVQRRPPLR